MDTELSVAENFPPEVWEMILKKVDHPIELIKLMAVCKTWRTLVNHILPTLVSEHWGSICLKEIFMWHISQILDKVFPTATWSTHKLDRHQLDQDFWREIFLSYRKWQLCVVIPPVVKKIIADFPKFTVNEKITCLGVHENIAAVGTSNGLINFFKIPHKQIFFQANHGEEDVTEVAFWYEDNRLIAVSTSALCKLKFWDISRRKEINSRGFLGQVITTTKNVCFAEYDGSVTKYKFQSGEIIAEANTWITRPVMRHVKEDQDTIVAMSPESSHFIPVLTFDGRKIKKFTIGYHYHETQKKADLVFRDVSEAIVCGPIDFDPSQLKHFHVYWKYFMIAITKNHVTFVNVVKEHRAVYNLTDYISGSLTCIAIHTNLLIFGTDSGKIYIFKISNYMSDLTNLDFGKSPTMQVILDENPVTSIKVTDSRHSQFIVATTERKVYVIQLQ